MPWTPTSVPMASLRTSCRSMSGAPAGCPKTARRREGNRSRLLCVVRLVAVEQAFQRREMLVGVLPHVAVAEGRLGDLLVDVPQRPAGRHGKDLHLAGTL